RRQPHSRGDRIARRLRPQMKRAFFAGDPGKKPGPSRWRARCAPGGMSCEDDAASVTRRLHAYLGDLILDGEFAPLERADLKVVGGGMRERFVDLALDLAMLAGELRKVGNK